MLLRDAPTVEVGVRIAAPADRVWDLLTDITLPARHSPELKGVEWLDGADSPSVGARFEGHNENPMIGSWTTTCTVVEVEAGRRWVWDVGDGVAATWAFELDPDPEGDAVIVRQWARLGPGPSGLTDLIASDPDGEAAIVSGRLRGWRRDIKANLEEVRRQAEVPPD